MVIHEEIGAGGSRLVIRDVGEAGGEMELKFTARRRTMRRDEMVTLFEQAWNAYDRHFYDPFFHGVDWKRVKGKKIPKKTEAPISERNG
jgi:hypothetical protein